MKEKIKNIATVITFASLIAIVLCMFVGGFFVSGSPEALICCKILAGLSIVWVVSFCFCFID